MVSYIVATFYIIIQKDWITVSQKGHDGTARNADNIEG